MANIKVSEMTEATSFDNGDYTMIVQANQNKKISKENILGNIEDDISTINTNISSINTNIGDLTQLKTANKDNLVNSINSLTSYTLFENSQGTNNSITLSDSKDNYTYLELFYNGNNGSASSVKMDAQNENKVNLFTANYYNSTLYIQNETIQIEGNTIARGTKVETALKNNTAVSIYSTSIFITKVIGYKEFIDEGE